MLNLISIPQMLSAVERRIIKKFTLKQKIILKEDCYFVLSTVQTFKGNPIYVCQGKEKGRKLRKNWTLTVVKENKETYLVSQLYCDYYFFAPKQFAEPYYRWQEIIRVFKKFSFLEGNLVLHSIILLMWGIWLLLTSSSFWSNFLILILDLSIIYFLCWLISSKYDY